MRKVFRLLTQKLNNGCLVPLLSTCGWRGAVALYAKRKQTITKGCQKSILNA